jgi:hypothetical protein
MSNRTKTAHEVADALAVARTSVYEWIRCGCPHDETVDPCSRGGKGYRLNVDEVQQWRATRVHGNTQAIRAPAAPKLDLHAMSSSRAEARARVTNILDQYKGMPTSTRTRLHDLVDDLIDTQEAIANEALKQIATTKRAANELVARRSNANGI